MPTLLSYGMGVESSAILLRWIKEPETRPCPLEDLIAITSQVGDEYQDTGRDLEQHILPLMRQRGMRYVQVARHGHLEADGITVLDDSRQPSRIFLEGDYKLSNELKRNGTVPQYAGTHRCALKFKAWVIETWLEKNLREPARHAFGYNADETKRIAKSEYLERIAFGFNADEQNRIYRSSEYTTMTRYPFYPLLEWGWGRERCIEYIRSILGVTWRKSACVYCPFNALRTAAIERHREHPEQVADAMVVERLSLALNPRGSFYKGKSLIQVTATINNTAALDAFDAKLAEIPWAIYRTRRIYSKKGKAHRAIQRIAVFPSEPVALAALFEHAQTAGARVEVVRDIPYVWLRRREERLYPTREELLSIAPALADDKARYGMPWFENHWHPAQEVLFDRTSEPEVERCIRHRAAQGTRPRLENVQGG